MKKQNKRIIIGIIISLAVILLIGKIDLNKEPSTLSTSTLSVGEKIFTGKTLAFGIDDCGIDDCPSGYKMNCQCDPNCWYTCDPINQDCSNDPSKKYDCSRECTVSGHIYQYNTDECCPPDFPFQKVSTNQCYSSLTSDLGSDNYYTRRSSCTPPQTKCEGNNYYECKEATQYIYALKSLGIIKGRCGIECINEEKCEGNIWFTCTPDGTWGEQGEVISKCGVNCKSGVKEYQTCSESFVPNIFIKRECISGNWIDKNQECRCTDNLQCMEGYECKESICQKKSNLMIYVYIFILVGTISLLSYVYFKIRRKR